MLAALVAKFRGIQKLCVSKILTGFAGFLAEFR
jgi:hypothetical protein